MKILIITLMIVLGSSAFAHCPKALEVDGEKFCYTVEWLKGERRKGENFVEVKNLSPVLNRVGDLPQKRIYSKLNFKMWLDGDKNHEFACPENFSIEPYMLKSLDHPDHGVSHEVTFVEDEKALQISKMPLRSMRGCWNLVWKKNDGEIVSLLESFEYSNLNIEEQAERFNFCNTSANPTPPIGGDHGDHVDHGGHH